MLPLIQKLTCWQPRNLELGRSRYSTFIKQRNFKIVQSPEIKSSYTIISSDLYSKKKGTTNCPLTTTTNH